MNKYLAFALLAITSMGCSVHPSLPPGFAPGLSTSTPAATPIAITSLAPAMGSFTGGTLLTINGAAFTADTTVTVGGKPCLNLTILTPESLTCVTPAHNPGSVSVVATNSTGSSTLNASYSFLPGTNAPLAQFAVLNGGGINSAASNGSIHLRGSAGAFSSGIQTGTGIISRGGVQGALSR